MPEAGYLLAAVGAAFAVTFALRALPFAVLKPIRESAFMRRMSAWMPAGILVVLALVTIGSSAGRDGARLVPVLVAVAVTVVVHLTAGRRTLLSVAAGTVVFVALVSIG